jgi:hypothetical protein
MLVFKIIGNDLYPEIDQTLIKELVDFYNQIMVYRLYLDVIDADGITFGEYRTNRIRMRKPILSGILVESPVPGEVFLLSGSNYEKYILSLYSQQIVFDPIRREYVLSRIGLNPLNISKDSNIQSFSTFPHSSGVINRSSCQIPQTSQANTPESSSKSQSCYPHYVPPPKETIGKRTSLVKFSSCQP